MIHFEFLHLQKAFLFEEKHKSQQLEIFEDHEIRHIH